MSHAGLLKGDRARVLNPHETTDGGAPGPWHYGKVIGFCSDDEGDEHPILALDGLTGLCAGVYFANTKLERVEKVQHGFSDN